MPEIILSICIPTYNRSGIVYECVKHTLKLESYEIEVVVCDNCSTDDTQERLSEFKKDERFHYYRNNENIGYKNFMQSVHYAKGLFAMIISDQDDIVFEEIISLIEFLKEHRDLSVIRATSIQTHLLGPEDNSIKVINHCNNEFYKKGIESVIAAICDRDGLTGIIFNRSMFSIESSTTYDVHPFINFAITNSTKGDYAKLARTYVLQDARVAEPHKAILETVYRPPVFEGFIKDYSYSILPDILNLKLDETEKAVAVCAHLMRALSFPISLTLIPYSLIKNTNPGTVYEDSVNYVRLVRSFIEKSGVGLDYSIIDKYFNASETFIRFYIDILKENWGEMNKYENEDSIMYNFFLGKMYAKENNYTESLKRFDKFENNFYSKEKDRLYDKYVYNFLCDYHFMPFYYYKGVCNYHLGNKKEAALCFTKCNELTRTMERMEHRSALEYLKKIEEES